MKLTQQNYYSQKANKEFMSVSQFKSFMKCEAMALAEIEGDFNRPQTSALLLGSFVDEMLTGAKKSQIKFIAENVNSLFQKSSPIVKINDYNELIAIITYALTDDLFSDKNKPYAEILQALDTVERIKNQPLMREQLSGKHKVIMTGSIAGVPFKIKMDSYQPNKLIADLKYMKSLRSPNLFESMVKYWEYDIQGAVYQEIVYQNTGERLPFYLNIGTKESTPHLEVAEIKQYDLDSAMETVIAKSPRFQAIKNGKIQPERCEEYDCIYCTETRIITEPIDSNLLGMVRKVDLQN